MSKFELQLKVQGLEFHVRGDRSDAPHLAQQIGHGVAAALQPTISAALADDTRRPRCWLPRLTPRS